MLERPRFTVAKPVPPVPDTLVLTKEMAVQPDLLPLQEQVARLKSLIAAGQFESSAVTEYADDIERIGLAINSFRETDPVVRQKQLQRYENALVRIGEALAAAETEPLPTTSEVSVNDSESVEDSAIVESNVVDVAEGERLVSEVNEVVQPLFTFAKEHLRRDGTPEHVEALKLISTLRLRYYQLDQAEQALKQAGDNEADVMKLSERVRRANDGIRSVVETLRTLPVMNGEVTPAELVTSENEAVSEIASSPEEVLPTDKPIDAVLSEKEVNHSEAEPIIETARQIAFAHAESSDIALRDKARLLLGAIHHYEANGHDHTLRDIEKHRAALETMVSQSESRFIAIFSRLKQNFSLVQDLKKAIANASVVVIGALSVNPDQGKQNTHTPILESAWSSEVKESPVTERIMINDGVLPQVETGIVEVTRTSEQFATQSAAVEATPITLDAHAREDNEQDVVFKETGIKIEEPKQVETTAAFFGKDATYIPADPNIVLDEERPLVTGSLPVVESHEPLTEKVVTTESISPEKIKFVIGEGPDFYIENYWPKLVEERSSDIPEEVHDQLVRQVITELYNSVEMQRALGIREGKTPNDIYAGDEIDYTVMLNRLRELESFTRMRVSESPAPLGAAEEYAVSEGVEAPVATESESTSLEGESGEAPAFDEARFGSWLSENFNIDLNERWFSSMFSSGFDNKSLLNLTIGEATELSLMDKNELATELVARKIDINVFNKLNGLIVSARRTGELPSEVKNDRLVSDFLAEQFTKLTA